MKIKCLLTIILVSTFLSGCGMIIASESPKENDTIKSEQKIKQKTEIQQNQTRANNNRKITAAPNKPIANAVCPVPAKPCHHREKQFDDWELSFRMPARLKGNVAKKSALFFAVIIKKYEFQDCDGGEYLAAAEQERKRVQAIYPNRKVFADYECPNMAAVDYNFPEKFNKKDEKVFGNFIAIYAGETKEAADQLLKELQAEYPQAEIKKMTAVYEKIVQ